MIRGKLQSVTDYKLMTVKECFAALGWSYTESGKTCENIQCSCGGGKVSCSGYFGTERLECKQCGKEMLDLFSPIQTTNNAFTVLDYQEWELDEEGRCWVAMDTDGGIKI